MSWHVNIENVDLHVKDEEMSAGLHVNIENVDLHVEDGELSAEAPPEDEVLRAEAAASREKAARATASVNAHPTAAGPPAGRRSGSTL